MVFSAYFSLGRQSPRAGAHLSVSVDSSTGDIESIEVLSPLVDDEVAAVIAEAFRAVDAHTASARQKILDMTLADARGDVGIGGRLTGKAGRFAVEANAVVPRETFSEVVGAVHVTVGGDLAFHACTLDDAARVGVPHETILRQALAARAGATQRALTRWRDAALGALEATEGQRALLPPSTPDSAP